MLFKLRNFSYAFGGDVVQVFHVTSSSAATFILVNGFRDYEGTDLSAQAWPSVWVSDRLIVVNEGDVSDEAMLMLDIPESIFEEYEWMGAWNEGYRESLIPAMTLNRFSVVLRSS